MNSGKQTDAKKIKQDKRAAALRANLMRRKGQKKEQDELKKEEERES